MKSRCGRRTCVLSTPWYKVSDTRETKQFNFETRLMCSRLHELSFAKDMTRLISRSMRPR